MPRPRPAATCRGIPPCSPSCERARPVNHRSMRRRALLRLMLVGGSVAVGPAWAIGLSPGRAGGRKDRRVSLYGEWVIRGGLPAFAYDGDQDTLTDAEWDPTLGPRSSRPCVVRGT